MKMKDCHRKPIIINLGERMSERVGIAEIVKKRFEDIKSRTKKCKSIGYNSRKNKNVFMLSECDDVLKNDFKWLINFNLKEIPIHDVDEELPGNNLFKGQRRYRRKHSVLKHEHKILLSDFDESVNHFLEGDDGRSFRVLSSMASFMGQSREQNVIEQCLFIKDEATIKEINKWISDAFPCFKTNGCTWKNSVRKTLLNNPIFKKRKRKLRKSDLWCLDQKYLRDSSEVKEILHPAVQPNVCENNLMKSGSSKDFIELTNVNHTMQERMSSDENAFNITNMNSISTNIITEMNLPEIWIESRELYGNHNAESKDEDLIERYEMPVEFEGKNEDTVSHFLEENNMLIPIHLI